MEYLITCTCESCGTQFGLDTEVLREAGEVLSCPVCGELASVGEGEDQWADAWEEEDGDDDDDSDMPEAFGLPER